MLYKFIFKKLFTFFFFVVVEPCPQDNTINGIALMSKDHAPSPTICLESVGVTKTSATPSFPLSPFIVILANVECLCLHLWK